MTSVDVLKLVRHEINAALACLKIEIVAVKPGFFSYPEYFIVLKEGDKKIQTLPLGKDDEDGQFRMTYNVRQVKREEDI